MPHVADGELHAWLDGALAHEAPEEAKRVAAHLMRCGDCRVRLERASELRDRAAGLLEAAAPRPGAMPPFEVLAARAGVDAPEAGGGPGGWRGPVRPGPLRTLAWAASLLLGVGLGWAGRAAWQADRDPAAVALAERSPPAEAWGRAADRSPPPGAASEVGQGRPEEARNEAAPATLPTEGEARRWGEAADPDVAAAAEDAATPEPGDRLAARVRAVAGEVSEEPEVTVADEVAIGPTTFESRPPGGRLRKIEEGADRAAAQPREGREGAAGWRAEASVFRDAGEEVWIPAAPEDAARWVGGRLLLVEGLPLVEAAVSTGAGLPIARVRQRLPSGDVLELRQRPASEADRLVATDEGDRIAAAETTAAGALGEAEGLLEARARVDGFEVRLRAPVAADSLRVLLSRLRPRRP